MNRKTVGLLLTVVYLLKVCAAQRSSPGSLGEMLEIYNTPISTLNSNIFNNKNVRQIVKISLINCQIMSIEKHSFNGMARLVNLTIKDNFFISLSVETFGQNTALQNLDLAKNRLQQIPNVIFDNLSMLATLDLGYNQIQNIDNSAFRKLGNLKVLRLNNNKLYRLPADLFSGEIRSNLLTLNLNNNNLNNLTPTLFAQLLLLKELDLSKNQIASIPNDAFINLFGLTNLNLEGNKLVDLESGMFDSNVELQKLSLSKNALQRIQAGLFNKLTKLQALKLNQNNISRISENAMPNTRSLVRLSLCNNHLRYLHVNVLKNLRQLKFLCLNDNPWFCDCNLMQLQEYYYLEEEKWTVQKPPICAGPPNFANIVWTEIENKDLICDDMTNAISADANIKETSNASINKTITGLFDPGANRNTMKTTEIPALIQPGPILITAVPESFSTSTSSTPITAIPRPEDPTFPPILKLPPKPMLVPGLNNFPTGMVQPMVPFNPFWLTTSTKPPPRPTLYTTTKPEHSAFIPTISPQKIGNVNTDINTNNNNCGSESGSIFNDKQITKNLVGWRAKLLGELFILYSSVLGKLPNNEVEQQEGGIRLVPHQNGFTFTDANLDAPHWEFINSYLSTLLVAATDDSSKEIKADFTVLSEISVLLDSASLFVKQRIPKDFLDRRLNTTPSPSSGQMFIDGMKFDNLDMPKRQVSEENKKHPSMETMIEQSSTEKNGNFFYYIRAHADGHGYVNINTQG